MSSLGSVRAAHGKPRSILFDPLATEDRDPSDDDAAGLGDLNLAGLDLAGFDLDGLSNLDGAFDAIDSAVEAAGSDGGGDGGAGGWRPSSARRSSDACLVPVLSPVLKSPVKLQRLSMRNAVTMGSH